MRLGPGLASTLAPLSDFPAASVSERRFVPRPASASPSRLWPPGLGPPPRPAPL